MYEVTIHFTDGREPAIFAAEEFDIPPEARDEEGGLRRYAYLAPGGGRATVCLNPGLVAAIVPALVEPDRERKSRIPERLTNGAVPVEARQPVSGQESEPDKGTRYPGNWPKPSMADLQWGRFPRSIDLEGEILTFLARFDVATPRQLMRWNPLHKHFVERGEYYPRAVERFFGSEERACDYLDAMKSEDLLTSNAPRFRSDLDSLIRPTEKGVELVGLGSVCEPHKMPMHGWGYHLKMVDLYQGIMRHLREEAAWVTGSELRSEEQRARREEELGRKLPTVLPDLRQFWPSVPEAVLVLKDSGIVAAVGLDTTRVSEPRMAAYETVFETLSNNSALDRAYYFFIRENVRPRVEKLVERHQRDGFFELKDYRAEDPLGTTEGRHPVQTPV